MLKKNFLQAFSQEFFLFTEKVRDLLLILGFAFIGIGGGIMVSQLMNLILSQVAADRTREMLLL